MLKPTIYRNYYCGELSENEIEKEVKLSGWIANIRDHGGVIFLDLRDETGVIQLVSNDDSIFTGLTKESTITVDGCVRKRKEDDWIEDELFGKYYIKDEQMPADDNRTGGYRYQLKFVSWYWMWAQKNMMLVVTLPTGELYRKETQWHHTNTLAKQLEEVKKNLNALGYSNVNIDISGVEKEGNSFLMSYSGTNICDALTQIANTWECEWWVTGVEDDCTIHFGKCEDGDIIEFENGKNVVTMDINRNCDTYANKFYVFGSKDNVPTTYRKELIITAEEPNDALEYTTDKKLTPSMFSMQVDTELAAVNFPATLTKGTEDDILMLEDLFAWESSLNLNEVIFNKITIKKPTDSGAYIEASIPPVTLGKITVMFLKRLLNTLLKPQIQPSNLYLF